MAKTNDGISKRFDLPAVEQRGIGLSMSHYKKEIRYEIQKTETTEWPQKLFLLAHTRGKLAILQPINTGRTFGKMNDSLFTAGITHFMLIDHKETHSANAWSLCPTGIPINGKSNPINRHTGKEKKYPCKFQQKILTVTP